MKLQTLKGFRDFLPQDARKRKYVIQRLTQIFERYGFEPLETPALEFEELLTGKYGEEGEKLMYRFKDRGDRHVAMRYDQTVPLARVIVNYQDKLPLPFKRYQIQPVWRAENTQKGRYREFLQCDADILGVNSEVADAELLALASDGLKNLGFTNFTVRVNDRKIFSRLVEKGFISNSELISVVVAIDKLKKIGKQGVTAELIEHGIQSENAEKILSHIEEEKATEYIITLHKHLEELGQDPKHFVFDPTLARGLDYYTDLIFEIEVENISGSVCGGGRYNNLIKDLTELDIAASGFAYGFDRIIEAMEELNLFPHHLQASSTKVLVTVYDKHLAKYSLNIAYHLRENGINTQVYEDTEAKFEKQLKYADRKKIPFVILAGPQEKENDTVTIKNLITGEQKEIPRTDLSKELA